MPWPRSQRPFGRRANAQRAPQAEKKTSESFRARRTSKQTQDREGLDGSEIFARVLRCDSNHFSHGSRTPPMFKVFGLSFLKRRIHEDNGKGTA